MDLSDRLFFLTRNLAEFRLLLAPYGVYLSVTKTTEQIMIDLDRPKTTPKMQDIADDAREALQAPYMRVSADDNICSSVFIRGSFDTEWSNGIFQNSRYFSFLIFAENGKRYYGPGEKVTIELSASSYKVGKFRKYTGPPEKCIAKIAKWITENSV